MKYFRIKNGNGNCNYIDFFKENFKEDIILIEMKQDLGNGKTWCNKNQYNIFKDNIQYGKCGSKNCIDYIPRNGVTGLCKFKHNTLVGTGREFTLNDLGLKRICIPKKIGRPLGKRDTNLKNKFKKMEIETCSTCKYISDDILTNDCIHEHRYRRTDDERACFFWDRI